MFNYNIYIVQLRQIVFQPSLYVMWIMPTGRTQLWTVDLAELHKKKKINSLESNWIGNLQKQNFFFFSLCHSWRCVHQAALCVVFCFFFNCSAVKHRKRMWKEVSWLDILAPRHLNHASMVSFNDRWIYFITG